MSSISEFEREPHQNPTNWGKLEACPELLMPTTELFYAQAEFAIDPNSVRMNALDDAERKYTNSYHQVVIGMAEGWHAMEDIWGLAIMERYERRRALKQALWERTPTVCKTGELRWRGAIKELDKQGVEATASFIKTMLSIGGEEEGRWDRYELSNGYQRREVSAAIERLELDMRFERRIFDNTVLPKKGHLALLNRGARLLDKQSWPA